MGRFKLSKSCRHVFIAEEFWMRNVNLVTLWSWKSWRVLNNFNQQKCDKIRSENWRNFSISFFKDSFVKFNHQPMAAFINSPVEFTRFTIWNWFELFWILQVIRAWWRWWQLLKIGFGDFYSNWKIYENGTMSPGGLWIPWYPSSTSCKPYWHAKTKWSFPRLKCCTLWDQRKLEEFRWCFLRTNLTIGMTRNGACLRRRSRCLRILWN